MFSQIVNKTNYLTNPDKNTNQTKIFLVMTFSSICLYRPSLASPIPSNYDNFQNLRVITKLPPINNYILMKFKKPRNFIILILSRDFFKNAPGVFTVFFLKSHIKKNNDWFEPIYNFNKPFTYFFHFNPNLKRNSTARKAKPSKDSDLAQLFVSFKEKVFIFTRIYLSSSNPLCHIVFFYLLKI